MTSVLQKGDRRDDSGVLIAHVGISLIGVIGHARGTGPHRKHLKELSLARA